MRLNDVMIFVKRTFASPVNSIDIMGRHRYLCGFNNSGRYEIFNKWTQALPRMQAINYIVYDRLIILVFQFCIAYVVRYIHVKIHTGSFSEIGMLRRKTLCRLQFLACERSTAGIYQTRLNGKMCKSRTQKLLDSPSKLYPYTLRLSCINEQCGEAVTSRPSLSDFWRLSYSCGSSKNCVVDSGFKTKRLTIITARRRIMAEAE